MIREITYMAYNFARSSYEERVLILESSLGLKGVTNVCLSL
jgi:hypothetical protein